MKIAIATILLLTGVSGAVAADPFAGDYLRTADPSPAAWSSNPSIPSATS